MTDDCRLGIDFCFLENDDRFPIEELRDCSGGRYGYSRLLCRDFEELIEDKTTPKVIKCLSRRNFPEHCECEKSRCEEHEKVCDLEAIREAVKSEYFD